VAQNVHTETGDQMEPAAGIPEFFEELSRREHEPLLAKVTGRVRFDLVEAGRPDRWLVAVDQGAITVLHKGGPADCTIQADRVLFEGICRGEENATAAVLRGALVCSGDVELLFAIQRIFPGPPRERQAQSSVGAHDDREPGQDPGGQHLRGQRRTR
jgi:putative sterol carrier protein